MYILNHKYIYIGFGHIGTDISTTDMYILNHKNEYIGFGYIGFIAIVFKFYIPYLPNLT
jgi:hypothetical protein